eukprot:CAMPEP_0195301820 /NCGR_PEP_ID=MMETSP0707-20130614/30004_1 /TAXON_ID=33640 /ORGANISM="Asterionellopsis glacialis, Strain CCMP134" /LENGTH=49 /DNA_ID= /DNA_START= /DNA_END= /DNA_ORIENTATION=
MAMTNSKPPQDLIKYNPKTFQSIILSNDRDSHDLSHVLVVNNCSLAGAA